MKCLICGQDLEHVVEKLGKENVKTLHRNLHLKDHVDVIFAALDSMPINADTEKAIVAYDRMLKMEKIGDAMYLE